MRHYRIVDGFYGVARDVSDRQNDEQCAERKRREHLASMPIWPCNRERDGQSLEVRLGSRPSMKLRRRRSTRVQLSRGRLRRGASAADDQGT
jgi:hypothetical protein